MLLENIKLAIKDFGSNKLRTFLSVLGIVIGVGSVITITTLGGSATLSVQQEMAESGLQNIIVMPGWDSAKEVRRLFNTELAAQIKKEINGIEEVIPINQRNFLLKHYKNNYEGTVIAADEKFADIFNYELREGRFINGEDNQGRKSVVVLGTEIADQLFPDGDALGGYMRVYRNQGRSFKVVGVMKPLAESMRIDFDTSVYMPINTYSGRIERIESVGRYIVRVADGIDVMEVSEQLESYFMRLTGNPDSYRVMSPSTIAEMYTGVTQTLNLFLTGVAAISLIVGGIGIMNIMLVSVTERTKEIGIRKALGAPPKVIRGQFLTEAMILTLSGGCVGMVLGSGLSFLTTRVLRWVFAPQPSAFALALLFASAVGIFFGLYPAVKAAKLEPVEALSFE
jgi:ABC-type antimicrobial peptide transport system permease subunit